MEVWIFFFPLLFSLSRKIDHAGHGLQWVGVLVAILRGHKFPLLGLAQPAGHQLTRLEVLVNQPGWAWDI